jgi:hypothetical protein
MIGDDTCFSTATDTGGPASAAQSWNGPGKVPDGGGQAFVGGRRVNPGVYLLPAGFEKDGEFEWLVTLFRSTVLS